MKTLNAATLTLALSLLSTFSAVQGYPDRRSTRVQEDFADRFKNYETTNTDGELTDTVPPVWTPVGCEYDFRHDSNVFVDQLFCPDWCGDGQDFTFMVRTSFTDDCETFAN
jgi:hypothetical protein